MQADFSKVIQPLLSVRMYPLECVSSTSLELMEVPYTFEYYWQESKESLYVIHGQSEREKTKRLLKFNKVDAK